LAKVYAIYFLFNLSLLSKRTNFVSEYCTSLSVFYYCLLLWFKA